MHLDPIAEGHSRLPAHSRQDLPEPKHQTSRDVESCRRRTPRYSLLEHRILVVSAQARPSGSDGCIDVGHGWHNHTPGSWSWGSVDRRFEHFIFWWRAACGRVPCTVVASLISQHIDCTVTPRSLLSALVAESVGGDGIVVNSVGGDDMVAFFHDGPH